MAPALHRPIRWALIDENYDQVVKYATAIKNGTASTDAVLWRARCAVESPLHLRRRSADSAVTLLAALVHERRREITDDLTELLIATVHRIDARAHRKVTDELVNAFKRVDGKENLLFQIAEAALSEPDGTVSRVMYPAGSRR